MRARDKLQATEETEASGRDRNSPDTAGNAGDRLPEGGVQTGKASERSATLIATREREA